MHYKFIWYCFLVIFANTLLQYFLTIDFTGRIKKKPQRARVRQILLQHENPAKPSHSLHPVSAEFRLRLVCLLLFAWFVICFACQCMLLCACGCHLTGWFAQPTAVTLQHRRHRFTKVSLPGLFRVVCMFHPLILLVCM